MTLNRCPFVLITLSCFILLTACKQDGEGIGPVSKDKITGFVQKGPFISGTEIVLYELNEKLEQTGKSFISSVKDDKGAFQFNNISLGSPFILVTAYGYYFNENTGELSSAPLQLNALLDIRNENEITINILTHLERPRVEYLVGQGKTFEEAKKAAQKDIFNALNFPIIDVQNSEILDISQTGDGNAMLLAASVIMQGLLPVADMTQLLARLSLDISDDGLVTPDSDVIEQLRQNVLKVIFRLNNIRSLLEARYKVLGESATVPEFEDLVRGFLGEVIYDYDGNSYATVKINNQTWMAENLKVTHYENGYRIANATDGYDWSILTSGAYAISSPYLNESTLDYGNHYNWYAVSSNNGLCPSGWHIPSVTESRALIDWLGGEGLSQAGARLRYWYGWDRDVNPFVGYNAAETNSSGFSALPCGYFNGSGYPYNNAASLIWTATSNSADNSTANYWTIDLDCNVGFGQISKNSGLVVRCIKD